MTLWHRRFGAWILISISALTGAAAGYQSQGAPAEWDAAELALINIIGRGDKLLSAWPQIQILTPPIELPVGESQRSLQVLSELADQVPDWGPYFAPSGHKFRAEYKAFLDSLDDGADVAAAIRQFESAQDVAGAFRFNPSLTALAGTFAVGKPTTDIHWESGGTDARSTNQRSARRVRVRIGRGKLSVASSTEVQELVGADQSASFGADGLEVVYILPGRWFSQSLMAARQSGPFRSSTVKWFGANGRLALRVRGVVIARNPRFDVRLDARVYRLVKDTVSGGGSFAIGPFVGGQGGVALEFIDGERRVRSSGSVGTFVVAVLNSVNGSQ